MVEVDVVDKYLKQAVVEVDVVDGYRKKLECPLECPGMALVCPGG